MVTISVMHCLLPPDPRHKFMPTIQTTAAGIIQWYNGYPCRYQVCRLVIGTTHTLLAQYINPFIFHDNLTVKGQLTANLRVEPATHTDSAVG